MEDVEADEQLVNRKLQLKMYRIWLQIKAVKSTEEQLNEDAAN
jgi:hypothetical protein